jgi:hypothetical protein
LGERNCESAGVITSGAGASSRSSAKAESKTKGTGQKKVPPRRAEVSHPPLVPPGQRDYLRGECLLGYVGVEVNHFFFPFASSKAACAFAFAATAAKGVAIKPRVCPAST